MYKKLTKSKEISKKFIYIIGIIGEIDELSARIYMLCSNNTKIGLKLHKIPQDFEIFNSYIYNI
jgi:hypothetical protein